MSRFCLDASHGEISCFNKGHKGEMAYFSQADSWDWRWSTSTPVLRVLRWLTKPKKDKQDFPTSGTRVTLSSKLISHYMGITGNSSIYFSWGGPSDEDNHTVLLFLMFLKVWPSSHYWYWTPIIQIFFRNYPCIGCICAFTYTMYVYVGAPF